MLETSKKELVQSLKDNIDGLPETEELQEIKEMINKIDKQFYMSWEPLLLDQSMVYNKINTAWAHALTARTNKIIADIESICK